MTTSRVSVRLLLAAISLAFVSRVTADTTDADNTRHVRSHASFLSDDLLEGASGIDVFEESNAARQHCVTPI